MDPRDEDYEVLEPGAPEDPAQHGLAGLPALDLGDRTVPPVRPVDRATGRPVPPAWQRWAALAVAFLVGVLGGAYVAHSRAESSRLAAEATRVELVAGQVAGVFSYDQFGMIQRPHRLAVALHNAGTRDVRVSDVRLREWQFRRDSDTSRIRSVPSGGWTRFVLVGDIACTGTVPRRLEVDVRTAAGESSVVVPLPPAAEEHEGSGGFRRSLDSIYRAVCGDDGTGQITAGTINTRRNTVDPQVLQMGVQLLTLGAEAEITAVRGSASGYRGVGSDLPVRAGGERRSNTVTVDWRIDNCPDTAVLDEARLEVELSEAGTSTVVPVVLPSGAVAALARFGAEECGP